MDYTFRLPLSASDRPLSELIIIILSQRWPLSGSQLHDIIRKRHRFIVSYQGVHKAANELVEQGVLIKDERVYMLNVEWLEQLITFGFQIKRAYEGKG